MDARFHRTDIELAPNAIKNYALTGLLELGESLRKHADFAVYCADRDSDRNLRWSRSLAAEAALLPSRSRLRPLSHV